MQKNPNKTILAKFSKKQQQELFEALYYFNMSELKQFCESYKLPAKGKKAVLIDRIKHYLQTGKVLQIKEIPAISITKKNIPLKPNSLILKGAYKNDLKTRMFFKKLIGNHFHFTAFGQDWIFNLWQKGKPPTYQEFADYWQNEYSKRQKRKAKPKQEWAYLSFLQRYQKENPSVSRTQAIAAWEKVRTEKVSKLKKSLLGSKKI